MSPTIRLLGSIEVLSDCRDFHPINLGPGRQRAVLAVLLLAAPQAVAVDDLIDRVWGEDLPVAARGSVRAHICRVRKAVAASGVLEIDRVGVGYRAVFNPDGLDLYQFRVLVGQARTASRTGDLESAYTGLSAALELWTGPALGGADSCWLADQRAGLAFERRDALTQRVDLAIRLGEHAQIVPGLILECCSEPYDERLAGHLMLALSASGRTGESLAVYDRMRRRLREELGTEPGSGLRTIHQQILRSDPSPPSPSPRRVVPQLPPATSGFIDRVAEHARLDDTLLVAPDQSAQPAVLTGMGGVGKTSLAVQWAHSRRAEFPDGQLFVDLQGFDAERAPLSAESALRGLLLALGADPAALPIELNDLTGMYRTLLARRKVLVVADNARSSAQVRPLLPPSPSVGVVTSRSSLDGLLADPGATLIPVEMLPADEARQLIERPSVVTESSRNPIRRRGWSGIALGSRWRWHSSRDRPPPPRSFGWTRWPPNSIARTPGSISSAAMIQIATYGARWKCRSRHCQPMPGGFSDVWAFAQDRRSAGPLSPSPAGWFREW